MSGGTSTGLQVTQLSGGDWLLYRTVNFGQPGQFNRVRFNVLSPTGVDEIVVHVDSLTGPTVADLVTLPTGTGYFAESTALSPGVSGIHDTYVVVSGAEAAGLDWFELFTGATRHVSVTPGPAPNMDAGAPDVGSTTPRDEQDDTADDSAWLPLPKNVSIAPNAAEGLSIQINTASAMIVRVTWTGGAGPVAIFLFDQAANPIAPLGSHASSVHKEMSIETGLLAPQTITLVVQNTGTGTIVATPLVGFLPSL